MTPFRTTACALATAASLAVPAASGAQDRAPSIHLTPARAAGIIERGQTIGPFTLSNGTDRFYRVNVFPVLLGQDRRGGLNVRDDPVSLRLAAARLAVQVRGFPFPPGGARSVFSQVRSAPPGRGFYGGILFRATPARVRGEQITNVLQINGRITLDPPVRQRRFAWRGGSLRAQQEGPRRLRLLVPVTNRGNTFALVSGVLRVRDPSGRVVVTRPLRRVRVLPDATVDLPTVLTRPVLPAGRYTMAATLRGGTAAAQASGRMDLFGPNEVRTELARIVKFDPARAYIGDETTVRADFRNTGNVKWKPRARLEVRALRGAQIGPVVARETLDAESVGPGERGEIEGKVRLPEGTRSFELRVRLVARDGRELDSRATSVTPVKRPPLTTRVKDFVTENAIVIVLLILAGVAVAGVLVVRYIRRLQAAARQ
ncbi:MAG TPA: hypothetical protein VNB64_05105 [Solirubrobacteraceae bacterium]|nr:hypothetical protein [Solirubrobacteraceae bacterium]